MAKGRLLREVLLALNLIEKKVLIATLNMQASKIEIKEGEDQLCAVLLV